MELKHFTENEFFWAHPKCSLADMDEEFMHRIDKACDEAGVPFHVNSAYRSQLYENQNGRNGTSSHCKGVALDIHCITPICRFKIVQSLINNGFFRIGIYPTFIHVDADPDKDPAIWISKSGIKKQYE